MYNDVYNKDFYDLDISFLQEKELYHNVDLILTSASYNEDFNSNYLDFFRQCDNLLSSAGALVLLTSLNNKWMGMENDRLNSVLLCGISYYANKYNHNLLSIGIDDCGNYGYEHYIFYFVRSQSLVNKLPKQWMMDHPATNRNEVNLVPFRGEFLDYVGDFFTSENGLICDPFAGWNTVGIWCEKNKRNYVGFERSEVQYKNIFDRKNDVIKMLGES